MAVLSLCRSGTLPRLCAFFVALSTGALFVLVGCFALPVLWSAQGGLIFSWVWLPPKDFGILPMLAGSLILSFSALLLAWPLSLGLACALQAPASSLWRRWLTALIRFMTAIPTVVYGFAAVFLLTPLVREAAGQGSGLCWLSAACVLALLISPTMVLVMDVALGQQMRRLLLPALALGMTRDRILACLALPAARRWLLTAGLLGFGRAIGDTLIPLMLSGNAPHLPQNLFAGLRTLTAHMGLVTATDVGGPAYNSLFVAGGFLLCISTGVSLVLRRLEKRSEALLPSVPAFWRQAAPAGLCLLSRGAGLLCSVCVLSLLAFLFWRGLPALDAALLVGDAPLWPALLGRFPIWDGIWPACLGTLCLLGITMALALLPGIGCGVYLAEYAPPRMQRILNSLMDVLAGVPSIVMGIFGFTLILFLHRLGFAGASSGLLLAGGCLALLVLPALVVTTRTALESLPADLRLSGAALGLRHGQTVRHLLLPQASRGILSGVMLALGRSAEDTAVILLTGVVANAGLPAGLGLRFEALPFFIYYTAAQYQTPEELQRGFGAALTLLALSGSLLLLAWWLHERFRRERQPDMTPLNLSGGPR
ncbi:ABC transporter permease subunit [uncultured Desulfovibrio sp.]|uniref:phosphate ABC transporter permease n=1 Tax=uncultured Desulfovibrio sp. TaxID=167968 RepID=UPI002629EC89|nr:ABC transporter permease subunit [uncultured Desulfovibrio sp.]